VNAKTLQTIAQLRARKAMGIAARRRRMPRQIPPDRVADDYVRDVLRLVAPRLRAAFQPLLAELPGMAARARSRLERHDADDGKRVRALIRAAGERINPTEAEIATVARASAERTSAYQRVQLDRQIGAALGGETVRTTNVLGPMAEAYIDANVGLITNIGNVAAFDVEMLVLRGIQDGTRHEDMAAEIAGIVSGGEERAKLIARDQVGKIYGQINAARQRQMGVTRFVWRTSNDARVRDEHTERQEASDPNQGGTPYSYDEPPDGELPGEPILCRCHAEPFLDDILDALDD